MDLMKNVFIAIREKTPEELELSSLKNLMRDINTKILFLSQRKSAAFYGELSTAIRSLLNNYVLEEKNPICSPVHKCLFLFYQLYKRFSTKSFMDKNFLLNFIFKRIFLFYNSLNFPGINNLVVINDNIINLCKKPIMPIIHYCLNIIVNKFIFEKKENYPQIDYFLDYFKRFQMILEFSEIKNKISEIYFMQLICLDDFANNKIKEILKDEIKVKKFIREKITELNNLNKEHQNSNGNNNQTESNMLFLFLNDFNESNIHLLRYLRKAIISAFTPVDSNVLDFFEINIKNYIEKNKNICNRENKQNIKIKLDKLKDLFFENNIQDVDIKIRNLSNLIDIIMEKYFSIQNIPEIDLIKFPRLNIIINRLFIEQKNYLENDQKQLVNSIFEHFIISQFIYNYMKYQIKDPEHYPIEIRYFAIFSYLQIISEPYIKTNPFSAYIASITLKEIINFLRIEKEFKKQKYVKNSEQSNILNDSNLNNSGLDLSMENSSKKTKRRKSISRSKKKKKKNKKKSYKKPENKEEKINISISDSLVDMCSNLAINSDSKGKEIKMQKTNDIEEPEKLLSKTLFNYLCFIYSMENNYKNFSKYFADFYSFIDDYIVKNFHSITFDKEWTWLLISSIDYIKNFKLNKTYEKFEMGVVKNNVELNVKLITFLSKKLKYCNIQENHLILDVLYYILINMNDLQNILKREKFAANFKKINKALSFLYFNINYLMESNENIPLTDLELIADRFVKITNLLFIESVDEYFWIPKSLKLYRNYNDFMSILEYLFSKILCKKSLFTELFLLGYVAVKKYNNRINPYIKSNSKKEKEREQYIYALDYFCKLQIPCLNEIKELQKYSLIKSYIFNLMDLSGEYNFENDLNDRVYTIKNVLLSGENDLKVCLFIICQLITNKKLDEKSNQDSKKIDIIKKIFKTLIDEKNKNLINFAISIYKSIEKYLYDLIDEYVQDNFPENKNFSKKDYSKFLDYFNLEKPLEQNNKKGKEIQIIYNNWTLIQKNLEKSGVLLKFLQNAEELNYPKTVMNITEKYIFDLSRKYNIHKFSIIKNLQKEDEEILKKKMNNYLKLYYKAYSHIEDNEIILDNYFNNNGIFPFIGKNKNNNDSKNSISIRETIIINLNELQSNIEKFFINLDESILSKLLYTTRNIGKEKVNNNYMILKLIPFLYKIKILNAKNMEMNQRKTNLTMIKIMEKHLKFENLFNKNLNEANSLINYSFWIYELNLYLEQFEIYFNKCNTNFDFFDNIQDLTNKLRNKFINKRKIPHLKRFLLLFGFRRFLFNLYGDQISELYCLMDMCKVYKTIYETGISIQEINNFREILFIFMENLVKIDDNILINIDKKLIFIALKYYVKYFPTDKIILFNQVYNKYVGLYSGKNKKNGVLSHKITILQEKLKVKNGFVGINEILLKKINELKNNVSQNNEEGLILYTDFYLDQLLNNKSDFDEIKPREDIKKIQFYAINENILNYLENAIIICIKTEQEKYLRKYMPEIINLFFKLNLATINFIQIISQTQSQSLNQENLSKFLNLLNKFKNDVSINKIKIIIPQLIICYQYEKTPLYEFAVELLASYAQQNIDLMAFLLSSFLNFRAEDLELIGIRPYKKNHHNNYKYNSYVNTFNKSKNFVIAIKKRLNSKNQEILSGYESFCQNLSSIFYESKNKNNLSRLEVTKRQNIYVNEINSLLNKIDIILPTLDNINKYKSSVRNDKNDSSTNNILFLKELDTNIKVLSSKEKPLHIRFKTRNKAGDICPRKYYDFLLKCDANDITKEIKTFEIIDEINNLFKMKHYDTNESMSLKRYLIVPIAPVIILAEWLNDCISFSSVIEEQSKKDLIYQDEYDTIINNNTNPPSINKGSLFNEDEKFNILYNYYQYKFFNPNLWYNSKKKYIISSAIWSMTQFLVGLGDRHPGNIMFNTKDGEVVHIDFGYVALKGLSLGVPEIVDFRLTFNLLKNLGLFEENGLFNYICVKVLKIFKEYYKTLSARIEYYQFDPLFDRDNDNKTFELFKQNDLFFQNLDDTNVRKKLNELIVKNTNPENLEKMYIWWSPWV